MAEIKLQDPGSTEVKSPLIAGMIEGLNVLSKTLGSKTKAVVGATMSPVNGLDPSDPRRIYQVSANNRLWLDFPSPVIYLNGAEIHAETNIFEIDYVGGSISFYGEFRPLEGDTITADFTHVIDGSTEVDAIAGLVDSAQQSANKAQATANQALDSLGKTVPTGTITWFSGSTPPEGFLACNGAEVSRESYAALFAVISTKFGEGDGNSTFNLPDLRGAL